MGLIRKVYSWAGMQVDVTRYLKACLSCQRLRPGTECLQGFITSHPVDGPFSRVHMDIFEVGIAGQMYRCLTMIDHHTKWAEVKAIEEKTAAVLAETFVKEWVCRFGCPATLVVDNERGFTEAFMQQLCQILGTKHLPTTACHPDANAPIESFHRVLTKGLQRFVLGAQASQLSFDEVVQLILFGYRTSFHSSTRETPAYLALGMDPRPPLGSLGHRNFPNHADRIQVLNSVLPTDQSGEM